MKSCLVAIGIALVGAPAYAGSGGKVAAPAIGPQKLQLNSEPSGAIVMVLLDRGTGRTFQCVTPCTVRIPQGVTFRIVAAKEGYEMAGPQPAVTWEPKTGAWWQGNMGYVLQPDSVTLVLTPTAQPERP